MKHKKTKSWPKFILIASILIFLVSTLFISCKKNIPGTASAGYNMDKAAKILGTKKISGSLESISIENELVLNYNKGNRFIFIDKLPGSSGINIAPISSADLIVSDYGVIIKDLNHDKIWLLVNNDEQSARKFEALRSDLIGNYPATKIFGITLVNS